MIELLHKVGLDAMVPSQFQPEVGTQATLGQSWIRFLRWAAGRGPAPGLGLFRSPILRGVLYMGPRYAPYGRQLYSPGHLIGGSTVSEGDGGDCRASTYDEGSTKASRINCR